MLTKYGLPQVAVIPGILVCVIAALAAVFGFRFWAIPVEVALLALLVFSLSFFRDPRRDVIADDSVLYSPCDGTVTGVSSEDGAIKISVFLSLFSVHINRSPCRAVVESVEYKRGSFRSATDPESSRVNESNDIALVMSAGQAETIIVRQVSGAIARRIVCRAAPGDALGQGERFGMIKFGSRTELIFPDSGGREVLVKPGDKVRAGLTKMVAFSG